MSNHNVQLNEDLIKHDLRVSSVPVWKKLTMPCRLMKQKNW